jgi:hypothetical protein
MRSSVSVMFSNNQLNMNHWLEASEEFLKRNIKEILTNRIKLNKIKDDLKNSEIRFQSNEHSAIKFNVR